MLPLGLVLPSPGDGNSEWEMAETSQLMFVSFAYRGAATSSWKVLPGSKTSLQGTLSLYPLSCDPTLPYGPWCCVPSHSILGTLQPVGEDVLVGAPCPSQ